MLAKVLDVQEHHKREQRNDCKHHDDDKHVRCHHAALVCVKKHCIIGIAVLSGERDLVERLAVMRCVIGEQDKFQIIVLVFVGGDCMFDDVVVVVKQHKLLLLCAAVVDESPCDKAIAFVVHHLEFVHGERCILLKFLNCVKLAGGVFGHFRARGVNNVALCVHDVQPPLFAKQS